MDDLREGYSGIISGTTNNERKTDPRFKQLIELQKKINDSRTPVESNILWGELNNEIKKLGAESDDQIDVRCKRIIEFLKNQPYETIICCTHSGTIDAVLRSISHIKVPCYGDLSNGSNCSIMCIEIDNDNIQILALPNTQHIGLIVKSDEFKALLSVDSDSSQESSQESSQDST